MLFAQRIDAVWRLLELRQSPQVVYGKRMNELYWDDPYPIALALIERHPGVDPLSLSWEALHRWVIELPQFADDASVTSLYLLEDIQQEWYEEVSSR